MASLIKANTITNLAETHYIQVEDILNKTGDETIAGIKTFTSSPIVPTPITGIQAVNKNYADLKVALAEFTGTNQNLSGSGYQKLPGGLIIQWGLIPALGADGTVYVAFPISFPNNTLGIYSNSIAAVTSGLYGSSIRIKNDYSSSGFTAMQDSTPDSGSFYLAIGY